MGFESEIVTVDDYGDIQTVATVLIAPVIIGLIVYNAKGLVENPVNDDAAKPVEFHENPLADN